MSFSDFKSIYRKVNGLEVIRLAFRNHIALSAAFSVAANGLSRKGLEIVRLTMNHRLAQRIEREFRPFIDCVAPTIEVQYEKSTVTHNDTVWMLWLQGETQAPDIVRACIASVRRWLPEKNVVVLKEDDIAEYVTIATHVQDKWKNGLISTAHYTDIVRLELLSKFGGTWLDSTVLLTGPVPSYVMDSDLFLYQTLKPGSDGMSTVISNWFITAQAPSRIILLTKALLLEYWNRYDIAVDYFIFHHLFQLAVERYAHEWKRVVPSSNENPHALLLMLFDSLDLHIFNSLIEQTTVHKLTHKIDADSFQSEGTYYGYLIKETA